MQSSTEGNRKEIELIKAEESSREGKERSTRNIPIQTVNIDPAPSSPLEGTESEDAENLSEANHRVSSVIFQS